MRLKLVRNDDNFVVIAKKPNGTYKIKLLQLHFEFRKIKVDDSILSRTLDKLKKGEPYILVLGLYSKILDSK